MTNVGVNVSWWWLLFIGMLGRGLAFYPNIVDRCSSKDYTHDKIAREALHDVARDTFGLEKHEMEHNPSFQTAVDEIIKASSRVDLHHSETAMLHFNGEQILQANEYLGKLKLDEIVPALRSRDYGRARELIGRYIHTMADFYSNTNWVTVQALNHAAICSYLGVPEKSGLLSAMVDLSRKTCSDIEEQQNENGTISLNINNHGILMSGYRSGQDVTKPIAEPSSDQYNPAQGKCSHGGKYDDSRLKAPRGGINRESLDEELSPHGVKHHAGAAAAAVTATVDFFTNSNDGFGLLSFVNIDELKRLLGVIPPDAAALLLMSGDIIPGNEEDISTQLSSQHFYQFYFPNFDPNEDQSDPVPSSRLAEELKRQTANNKNNLVSMTAKALDLMRTIPSHLPLFIIADYVDTDDTDFSALAHAALLSDTRLFAMVSSTAYINSGTLAALSRVCRESGGDLYKYSAEDGLVLHIMESVKYRVKRSLMHVSVGPEEPGATVELSGGDIIVETNCNQHAAAQPIVDSGSSLVVTESMATTGTMTLTRVTLSLTTSPVKVTINLPPEAGESCQLVVMGNKPVATADVYQSGPYERWYPADKYAGTLEGITTQFRIGLSMKHELVPTGASLHTKRLDGTTATAYVTPVRLCYHEGSRHTHSFSSEIPAVHTEAESVRVEVGERDGITIPVRFPRGLLRQRSYWTKTFSSSVQSPSLLYAFNSYETTVEVTVAFPGGINRTFPVPAESIRLFKFDTTSSTTSPISSSMTSLRTTPKVGPSLSVPPKVTSPSTPTMVTSLTSLPMLPTVTEGQIESPAAGGGSLRTSLSRGSVLISSVKLRLVIESKAVPVNYLKEVPQPSELESPHVGSAPLESQPVASVAVPVPTTKPTTTTTITTPTPTTITTPTASPTTTTTPTTTPTTTTPIPTATPTTTPTTTRTSTPVPTTTTKTTTATTVPVTTTLPITTTTPISTPPTAIRTSTPTTTPTTTTTTTTLSSRGHLDDLSPSLDTQGSGDQLESGFVIPRSSIEWRTQGHTNNGGIAVPVLKDEGTQQEIGGIPEITTSAPPGATLPSTTPTHPPDTHHPTPGVKSTDGNLLGVPQSSLWMVICVMVIGGSVALIGLVACWLWLILPDNLMAPAQLGRTRYRYGDNFA